MNYKLLVEEISKRSGIDRDFFDLDIYKTSKEPNGLFLLKRLKIENNYYFSKIEYWENTYERWKSIALFIPIGILPEFLLLFNSILEDFDKETIDLKNSVEFSYSTDDESFNVVQGNNIGNYFRLEIAKKND